MPEYLVWTEMKQRCGNPKHKKFRFYGARGVRVCARWEHSFAAFIADMGRRPAGLTLDRKDSNGHYCPENCRWATWNVQRRNKRNNVWIEYGGKRLILRDWAKETGISAATLRQRLFEYKWSVPRALTEQPGTQRSNNRWISFNGLRRTAAEWARELGLSYQTLKTRLNKMQWSVKKALTTPVR
jgi:hypothetical protein